MDDSCDIDITHERKWMITPYGPGPRDAVAQECISITNVSILLASQPAEQSLTAYRRGKELVLHQDKPPLEG